MPLPSFLLKPDELGLDPDEMIVDLFAGGGGWSLAIELATGRSPDIAVNHDSDALAMHKANHPLTEHYQEDIYDVDPVIVCRGRRVGLLVMSPDCVEFSKAKNASITRDKKVRCLANVAHRWGSTVRPRVILLENVEEFETWGPLDDDGKIIKASAGEMFELWWKRLEHMGYRLSKKVLRACDYGAPTSRKRLVIIATWDETIDVDAAWPDITHGPGQVEPWRTAAECIDYSIPCPSIFMTAQQAKDYFKATGVRIKRPLVDKTMARIRRGIWKYVLNAARPFLVPVTHAGDDRVYDMNEPVRTVTGANRGEIGLVSPLITPVKTWGGGGNDAAPANRPTRTITTSKRGEFGVVAPLLTAYHGDGDTPNNRTDPPTDPLPTQDTSRRFGLVAPTLVQTGYGERPGQAPRCLDLGTPLGTVISGGNGNGNGKHALVTSFLEKAFSERETGGWNGGQPLTEPIGAITKRDHHRLVAGHMVKLRGTSESHVESSSSSSEEPVATISANGNHIAEVRAFLVKFYGNGNEKPLDVPLDTVTSKHRFGIVTVDGVDYQIVDIGFRMLKARELFRAQGFPDTYIIDPMVTKQDQWGRWKTAPLDETSQIEKCGNSVPPPMGAAVIRSVFKVRQQRAAA